MKRCIMFLFFSLCMCGTLFAQSHPYPYRVVFDLTSKDSLDHKAVVRWISEIYAQEPKAEVEVVMYAKGLEMVMPERSVVTGGVEAAMHNPNVSFRVCEIAMKNNNVLKSQLLPKVQTVPDGIYEIVSKQKEGWAYIKVSH